MNAIDIVIIIPLIWFAYKGFKNGLIKEVGTLLALILGIWGAVRLSGLTAEYIQTYTDAPLEYIPLIAFGATFLIIVVLIFVLAHLLDKFVDTLKLEWLNKLGGIVFGILKMVFIASALFFIVNQINVKLKIIPDSLTEKSLLYNPLSDVIEIVYPYIEKTAFDKGIENIQLDLPEKE